MSDEQKDFSDVFYQAENESLKNAGFTPIGEQELHAIWKCENGKVYTRNQALNKLRAGG